MPKPSSSLQMAKGVLRAGAARIVEDPLTNSVFDLARSTFLSLENGEQELDAIEALIDEVHANVADERAWALSDQHFKCDAETAWTEVQTQLEVFAERGWPTFKDALESSNGGIVFTGHPTFALPQSARAALAAHAQKPTAKTQKALAASLTQDNRAWSSSITLASEHAEVQDVLENAGIAMTRYARRVYAFTQARFPDNWRDLRVVLPTLASWVGYDLDGRTDIDWWQSVALRLSEKTIQLQRYADRVDALSIGDRGDALAQKLRKAAMVSEAEAELFAKDLSDQDALVDAVRRITSDDPDRITDAEIILSEIDELIAEAAVDLCLELLVLRAEIEALQLGTARVHLRVNATQVRAVINRDLGLETEDRDLGRLALQRLSEKAAIEDAQSATFADLFLEQSTARRQILMSALWLKHIDAGSPIRFLIAEAENPATVMGTLYLARQFGIEDRLDISPLFETPEALETGGRFIERLLREPAFLDYLKKRGYLSIQLGFSDAGRFIGQVAADMAIERIHNLIARALAKVDPSLGLLIFNTHGESMGRGAWPGSFTQRFDHVLTSWTRTQARQRDLKLRHEVSFQGGDGFLHFASPVLAETAYNAFCAHLLSEPSDCSTDPFYTETGFTWDTYRALRAWHERLFDNPDYANLLSDFATNFLVRAGSRQRRRSGGPKGPRSLRAISHNATLQQLGVPVNTAAGLGSAVRRETERLVSLLNRSPRMRGLLELALKARISTSVPALRAYAQVYDPSFWVAVSRTAENDAAITYRRVYYRLADRDTSQSIRRIADRFSIDLTRFDRLLAELTIAPSAEERHEGRLDLHVLHALRQAMMMHALALAGRLPSLSRRHDTGPVDFLGLILEMRIGEAADLLAKAFPRSTLATETLLELGGTPNEEFVRGYDAIHSELVEPLRRIDGLMHKTTLAIGNAYKAYG